MSTEWDTRHEANIYKWKQIDDIRLVPEGRQRHVVEPDVSKGNVLALDGLVIPRDSDTLFVGFHGALVRDKVDLPRFEWLRTLEPTRSESLLFIADTTLELDEKISIAWYIGTQEDNLTARLADYIRHIANLCGATKVVLAGNSAGGYASIAVGSRIQGSIAIAVSPQSAVRAYAPWTHAHLHRVSFPTFNSFRAAEESDISRFDLIHLLSQERAEDSRYWYVQNIGDQSHYEDHYLPFATAFDVDVTGGITKDGRGRLSIEDWGEGHVAPPIPRFREIIDEALRGDPWVPSNDTVADRGRTEDVLIDKS